MDIYDSNTHSEDVDVDAEYEGQEFVDVQESVSVLERAPRRMRRTKLHRFIH
jgi:hypothetical protein